MKENVRIKDKWKKRNLIAFTFVMDLVLYQIIYPREQNKENNGDIQ